MLTSEERRIESIIKGVNVKIKQKHIKRVCSKATKFLRNLNAKCQYRMPKNVEIGKYAVCTHLAFVEFKVGFPFEEASKRVGLEKSQYLQALTFARNMLQIRSTVDLGGLCRHFKVSTLKSKIHKTVREYEKRILAQLSEQQRKTCKFGSEVTLAAFCLWVEKKKVGGIAMKGVCNYGNTSVQKVKDKCEEIKEMFSSLFTPMKGARIEIRGEERKGGNGAEMVKEKQPRAKPIRKLKSKVEERRELKDMVKRNKIKKRKRPSRMSQSRLKFIKTQVMRKQ